MKYLKLFSLLVIVMLTSVMFVGCRNNSTELEWNEELQLEIKQDYYDYIKGQDAYLYRSIDDIIIRNYYGIYNNGVTLVINGDGPYGGFLMEETVAGFTFGYIHQQFAIKFWKEGIFYTLTQSYEEGLLKQEDIQTIYELVYS